MPNLRLAKFLKVEVKTCLSFIPLDLRLTNLHSKREIRQVTETIQMKSQRDETIRYFTIPCMEQKEMQIWNYGNK